ncbi:MAG: exonuclease domain-containing protein, partial [Chloroflexota bacterium]|nr:exonuclease domain-containing protein [Chloroflexota bacterium]
MKSIVALDLETTGLNSNDDAIIEIGAVRFNKNRTEAEWTSLINPGCRIPPFITQLTGINDQMVLNAPSIYDVLDELVSFIGDLPLLGHNLKFDLAFLQKHPILKWNDRIDTYDLASVLLPGASRYNLVALADALRVYYPTHHRALDDAKATRDVYLRLYEEAQHLPNDLLSNIVQLGESVEWPGYLPFRQVLIEKTNANLEFTGQTSVTNQHLFAKKTEHPISPLTPVPEPVPLDIDEATAILEPGGEFSKHFPQFEFRYHQVEMLRSVAQALSEGRHLMVEAGTGVGKSFAYLIPAGLWSLQNNQRVVISTNTINLQDQLINKDLPDLNDALGWQLRAMVLKGRSNYLCPRRLESLRRRGPSDPDEMRVLA